MDMVNWRQWINKHISIVENLTFWHGIYLSDVALNIHGPEPCQWWVSCTPQSGVDNCTLDVQMLLLQRLELIHCLGRCRQVKQPSPSPIVNLHKMLCSSVYLVNLLPWTGFAFFCILVPEICLEKHWFSAKCQTQSLQGIICLPLSQFYLLLQKCLHERKFQSVTAERGGQAYCHLFGIIGIWAKTESNGLLVIFIRKIRNFWFIFCAVLVQGNAFEPICSCMTMECVNLIFEAIPLFKCFQPLCFRWIFPNFPNKSCQGNSGTGYIWGACVSGGWNELLLIFKL